MVIRNCTFGFVAAVALLTLSSSALPVYQIGQKADQEIKTPVPLVVVDLEATEALKQREAQRVPVIYRYLPHGISEVEAAFRSTFDRTRSNFLDAVETRFGARTLPDSELLSPAFQRFLGEFQKQNVLSPVGPQLARVWVQGQADAEIANAMIAPLRAAMKQYVRPDTAPQDIWVGSTIRLISVADNETVTAKLANERGINVAKTNFISVSRAKAELLNSFPAEERTMGRYVSSFIKPNCEMEAELTRALREERTGGLLIADRYEPGTVLVRRGQEVDRKIKAALDQLAEKTEIQTPLERPAQSIVPAVAAPEAVQDLKPWLWAGGTVAALLLFILITSRPRRTPEMDLIPYARLPVASVPLETPAEQAWRERALQAEQQAAKAQAAVRSGVMSQLAGWMASHFTQKLVSQRTEMMDAHRRAAVEVAELEARLEKIQAPLQERLSAYETRIAELEKELSVKDAENRQLIQAKIQIIRKQLEIERDKHRLEFN
ncbi:MAG TPA: hypothetical protein VEH04_20045 [Verrucomicrobiae bacterium]|nr:hypothetical protein [Verrucomicrobiae bacterium]